MTKELGVSPIQEKALRVLLSFKVITYEDLVKVAFKENDITIPEYIPALTVLTFREAKIIIDHGYKICNSCY